MKLMIPFTPHLANECLELLNCKSIDKWPEVKKDLLEEIKFAVQVNGKTRDIISIIKGADQKQIELLIQKTKAHKFIKDKRIIKIIFVKNKIINYIINE